MTSYVRLCEGFNRYTLIPSSEDIWKHIKSNNTDYYLSLYQYDETGYRQWQKTNSVKGITNVTTNKLLFDFDKADAPDEARKDAIELVTRLLKFGVKQDNIQIAFSGNKGYNVEILTNKSLTPEEFKATVFSLAKDLKTFDTVVNDPQRIVRIVGTKHNKSGLYKMPLSVSQLTELSTEQIKVLAKDIDNIDTDIMEGWHEIEIPEGIIKTKVESEPKVLTVEKLIDLDMSLKPKWMTEAKFALQEGFFQAGERNTAFMILASTYKNQGFNKEIVYRMLKGMAELQARRSGQERYSDEELYNNIVDVVFSPGWKGGTYSYENTPLLQDVSARLGLKPPKEDEKVLVPVKSVSAIFKKFATEIDKNTIKLGIPAIDSKVRVTTSMLVGLLAAPSAGKTSVSLSILNEASKSNIKSVFFSLDMGAPLVLQRLIQKHARLNSKAIYSMYQNSDNEIGKIETTLDSEYKNVSFCFKSGITTQDIRDYIVKEQDTSGEKVRLVVVDYLECLQGPYSDATANTSIIAQQLKDIANDLEVCIVLLLQPQKHAGDPSSELLSYRNIKGSSAVEQAASVIFTMWRPGFSPKNPAEDKYLSIAVVKNRMGSLDLFEFSWDGLTGELNELDELQQGELDALKKRKAAEKAANDI